MTMITDDINDDDEYDERWFVRRLHGHK